jgi:hypothetical protein
MKSSGQGGGRNSLLWINKSTWHELKFSLMLHFKVAKYYTKTKQLSHFSSKFSAICSSSINFLSSAFCSGVCWCCGCGFVVILIPPAFTEKLRRFALGKQRGIVLLAINVHEHVL